MSPQKGKLGLKIFDASANRCLSTFRLFFEEYKDTFLQKTCFTFKRRSQSSEMLKCYSIRLL